MKIMIMCGGRGRRLERFTEHVPKPLVPFHGSTILELKMTEYLRRGWSDFIFCIGYKGEMIRKAASKYSDQATMRFSDAGEDAGILRRLWEARENFEEDIVLTYGDTFADVDLDDLMRCHHEGGNEATIVVAPIESPFGLVEYDRNNKVTYFKEKPTLNYYIGQSVISKSAFNFVHSNVIDMPDGEGLVTFLKLLMAMEKLGVYYHSGLDITFNTQEELRDANAKILQFYTAWEQGDEE